MMILRAGACQALLIRMQDVNCDGIVTIKAFVYYRWRVFFETVEETDRMMPQRLLLETDPATSCFGIKGSCHKSDLQVVAFHDTVLFRERSD